MSKNQITYNYYTIISPINFSFAGKKYNLKAGDIWKEEKEKAKLILESLPLETKRSIRHSGKVVETQKESTTTATKEAVVEKKPIEDVPPPTLQEVIDNPKLKVEDKNDEEKDQQQEQNEDEQQEEEQPEQNENEQQQEEKNLFLEKLEEMDDNEHWATVKSLVQDAIHDENDNLDFLVAARDKFSRYDSITTLIDQYLESDV